ncbi:ParB/Srx family N-terminal domain-containing protein [Psychromarinibacter halotolerans]|uniref:ParB/Srx family N-terminal domain-containing protein n=1 Tax=Psychromarinibacter halotolerans TaxID=1775175 RepID=A0ABV7GUW6_9RHOB|nr:ParB/Srx family N-terminal domain-containing protein [Psychromarinibacter halotolerans]MDF0598971.1 ParB/Srx family N-terminal domain-containing protein [Psychromarinibacter halotolerans]
MEHFRTIDIGTRPKITGHIEAEPPLEWVPIKSLVIDGAYQRPLLTANWKAITAIATAFTWARFTPVLLSPTVDGRYAVIDGQHRAHAALMRGYDRIPAMIVRMSAAEQAAAFAHVNGDTVKITLFHVYKAALAARTAWAVKAEAAVAASGCRLMTLHKSSPEKKPGEVFAIALIRTLVERGKADVVTAGLKAIRDSTSVDEALMYSANVLRPWLETLATSPEFLDKPLAEFLADVDLLEIEQRVDARRKASGDRGPRAAQLRLEIQRALTTWSAAPQKARLPAPPSIEPKEVTPEPRAVSRADEAFGQALAREPKPKVGSKLSSFAEAGKRRAMGI